MLSTLKVSLSKFKVKLCERGQKCSCWFDGWFGLTWAEFCERHDKRYMTPVGKGMTRWECDIELTEGVSSVCVIMAVVMFIGVRCFGWYYWKKFEKARNA